MSYHVACDCGKSHPVAAADAGTDLRCGCGRAVEVPPLHVLKREAGEEAFSPARTLQALLLAGQLPGTRQCAVCNRDTDGLAHASVQCLWARVVAGPSKPDTVGGCLLFVLFGWVVIIPALITSAAPPQQHGEDMVFTLPVRVCDECRPKLTDLATLRAALRQTPAYADLLDKYPAARIMYRG